MHRQTRTQTHTHTQLIQLITNAHTLELTCETLWSDCPGGSTSCFIPEKYIAVVVQGRRAFGGRAESAVCCGMMIAGCPPPRCCCFVGIKYQCNQHGVRACFYSHFREPPRRTHGLMDKPKTLARSCLELEGTQTGRTCLTRPRKLDDNNVDQHRLGI